MVDPRYKIDKPDKFIRELRKEVGLSQTDLAHALGVNPSSVSMWEGGQRLPNGTVIESCIAMQAAYQAKKLHAKGRKEVEEWKNTLIALGVGTAVALALGISVTSEGG